MEHCVISERPIIRGHRFDLGVYREDDRYYATWFCDACSKRGQTEWVGDQSQAREEAIAALRSHQGDKHPDPLVGT